MNVKLPKNTDCTTCIITKLKWSPFSRSDQVHDPLRVIATDLCGPFRVESLANTKYLPAIVDHCSNFVKVWSAQSKSSEQITENIKKFINE
jgi:hypothetical protein